MEAPGAAFTAAVPGAAPIGGSAVAFAPVAVVRWRRRAVGAPRRAEEEQDAARRRGGPSGPRSPG
ncbi:hypothetical protein ACRAR1_14305 [Streptomyces sanyensis]|uniref:hypothetical protein n=1 Tax=Streptomyces sanyensis TaxID=568869 RepID=UPI003D77E6D7